MLDSPSWWRNKKSTVSVLITEQLHDHKPENPQRNDPSSECSEDLRLLLGEKTSEGEGHVEEALVPI